MPRIVHELIHRVHEDRGIGLSFSIQVPRILLQIEYMFDKL